MTQIEIDKVGPLTVRPFTGGGFFSYFNKQRYFFAKKKEEICLKDEKKAITLLPAICDNINKLIDRSIFHIDLHSGNIFINDADKVFILDFDKVCYISANKAKLKKKYRQRWQRAIKEYGLSDQLSKLPLA